MLESPLIPLLSVSPNFCHPVLPVESFVAISPIALLIPLEISVPNCLKSRFVTNPQALLTADVIKEPIAFALLLNASVSTRALMESANPFPKSVPISITSFQFIASNDPFINSPINVPSESKFKLSTKSLMPVIAVCNAFPMALPILVPISGNSINPFISVAMDFPIFPAVS